MSFFIVPGKGVSFQEEANMVKGPPDQWNDHNVEQKDTINLDFLSDNRMGKHVNFIILKMYSS